MIGIVRISELDERIRQMTLYRDEVAAELKEWEKKREVAGHVCGLIEGSHIESAPNRDRDWNGRCDRG